MEKTQLESLLSAIKNSQIEFYEDWGFWISTIIGVSGIFFSIIAFKEAREAKKAAKSMGNFVKIQSMTIDLNEIIQRLDKISTDLDYSGARDFYSEINRRVRRIISVLTIEIAYETKTKEIQNTLDAIKTNLDGARPVGLTSNGIDIFYAIEGEFSNLSGHLADLSGLLEQRTI